MTHQTVLFQHEHARRLVERAGGDSPAVAAPRHGVNLGRVSGEFFTFVVVLKAFLHLLVVLRRHVDDYVIFLRRERAARFIAPSVSGWDYNRWSAFCCIWPINFLITEGIN